MNSTRQECHSQSVVGLPGNDEVSSAMYVNVYRTAHTIPQRFIRALRLEVRWRSGEPSSGNSLGIRGEHADIEPDSGEFTNCDSQNRREQDRERHQPSSLRAVCRVYV